MNVLMKSIMPTLSRLIIAIAMVTVGWVNCFVFVPVTPELAAAMQEVDLQVLEAVDAGDETLTIQTTRGLNRIAMVLHNKWAPLGGWTILIAWTACVFQLLAGILLFVGLFSRIAAIGVCIVMGMALFLVSFNINNMP